MALQRDFETLKEKNESEKQPVCTNPLSILKVVMKQCKNMQERMLSQLAAAESRHRKVGSPIGNCVLRKHSGPASHQGNQRGWVSPWVWKGPSVTQKSGEHEGNTDYCPGSDQGSSQTLLKKTFLLGTSLSTLGEFFFFQISVFQTLTTSWSLSKLVAEQSVLCLLI